MTHNNRAEKQIVGKRSRCEIAHVFGDASCQKPAQVNIDGLLFCQRHALEVKLEGQISCWRGILFHIDLWASEADRRQRRDIVQLLRLQRTEAVSAIERARADLDLVRSDAKSDARSEAGSDMLGEPAEYRESLREHLLRARGVRRLSRGLRRHSRR